MSGESGISREGRCPVFAAMLAARGALGRKVYVVRSLGLVVKRTLIKAVPVKAAAAQ